MLELEAGLPTAVLKPRVKTLKPKVSKGVIIPSERKEIAMLQKFQVKQVEKDSLHNDSVSVKHNSTHSTSCGSIGPDGEEGESDEEEAPALSCQD